jgi:hypothetical protein
MEAEVALWALPRRLVSVLDDDENMLVFLTSCLSACLDCACDLLQPERSRAIHSNDEDTSQQLEHVFTAISCISLWLSQVCVTARVTLQASSTKGSPPVSRLHEAAEKLRQSSFGVLSSPIMRSLLCLTNSPFHDENGDLALLAVLGLVRAVVGLVSTCAAEEMGESEVMERSTSSSSKRTGQPPENDLFGSMDDSLFLSIDLGSNAANQVSSDQGVSKVAIGASKLSKKY